MVSYNLAFDDDVIKTVVSDLVEAPRRLQIEVRDTVYAQLEKDIAPLKQEPAQPDYPFIWSHDPKKQAKARAWWFAYLKRTGNLNKDGGRYQRTHGLSQGWQIDINTFRASIMITISNPASRAVKWVQSVFQVVSHKRSGWVQYEGVLLESEERAQDSIINAWYNLIAKGKPK
jgi:hypothetical protein